MGKCTELSSSNADKFLNMQIYIKSVGTERSTPEKAKRTRSYFLAKHSSTVLK